MDSFFKIVIVVAIVLLIITLTIFGIMMSQSKSGIPFPPVAGKCPDYWPTGSGSGVCYIPPSYSNNIGTIYSSNSKFATGTPGINGMSTVNFADPGWSKSTTAICAQKNWANTYGIQWDGVSNYNYCK